MDDAFIGSIMMFVGNFAPPNWLLCNGSFLSISQYQALYSIIGTRYGGDGRTSFALPDFRGKVVIHAGQGPNLSDYKLGQTGGFEYVGLTLDQMPLHSHDVANKFEAAEEGTVEDPSGNFIAGTGYQAFNSEANIQLNQNSVFTTVGDTGKSVTHYNIPPFLTVNYIICFNGIYPPRN
ncbi:MAG: tail fiber protein [Bacteroidales bacterium]|nr:tail fiber protein [Bacteroidales bacterium]